MRFLLAFLFALAITTPTRGSEEAEGECNNNAEEDIKITAAVTEPLAQTPEQAAILASVAEQQLTPAFKVTRLDRTGGVRVQVVIDNTPLAYSWPELLSVFLPSPPPAGGGSAPAASSGTTAAATADPESSVATHDLVRTISTALAERMVPSGGRYHYMAEVCAKFVASEYDEGPVNKILQRIGGYHCGVYIVDKVTMYRHLISKVADKSKIDQFVEDMVAVATEDQAYIEDAKNSLDAAPNGIFIDIHATLPTDRTKWNTHYRVVPIPDNHRDIFLGMGPYEHVRGWIPVGHPEGITTADILAFIVPKVASGKIWTAQDNTCQMLVAYTMSHFNSAIIDMHALQPVGQCPGYSQWIVKKLTGNPFGQAIPQATWNVLRNLGVFIRYHGHVLPGYGSPLLPLPPTSCESNRICLVAPTTAVKNEYSGGFLFGKNSRVSYYGSNEAKLEEEGGSEFSPVHRRNHRRKNHRYQMHRNLIGANRNSKIVPSEQHQRKQHIATAHPHTSTSTHTHTHAHAHSHPQ